MNYVSPKPCALRTNSMAIFIHLKTIPGASAELMQEAGLYADRLSVNVESQAAYSVFAKTLLEIFNGKNG